MAKYVDGFVIPVPKKNLKTYRKLASQGCTLWMKYGALDYFECVGDDLNIPGVRTFTKLCKLKPSETVILAFIIYKSKSDRDRINAKVMREPSMKKMEKIKMPFDMKRFTMGGFKVFVESR